LTLCDVQRRESARAPPAASQQTPPLLYTNSFLCFVCVYVCGGVRRDYDIFSPNKGEILSSYSTRSGYFFYLLLFLFNSLQLFHFPPPFLPYGISLPLKKVLLSILPTHQVELFFIFLLR
jgi:hypothetical protein